MYNKIKFAYFIENITRHAGKHMIQDVNLFKWKKYSAIKFYKISSQHMQDSLNGVHLHRNWNRLHIQVILVIFYVCL